MSKTAEAARELFSALLLATQAALACKRLLSALEFSQPCRQGGARDGAQLDREPHELRGHVAGQQHAVAAAPLGALVVAHQQEVAPGAEPAREAEAHGQRGGALRRQAALDAGEDHQQAEGQEHPQSHLFGDLRPYGGF